MEKTFAFQIRDLLQSAKSSAFGQLLKHPLSLYRRAAALNRRLTREVYILSGSIGGERLRIFFAGSRPNMAYIAKTAFGDEVSEKKLGKAYVWTIPFMLLKQRLRRECQLSIVETGRKKSGRSFEKGFFVPCWTGGFVDASDETRETLKSIRWDMQKINRFKLCPEISTDPALYEFFHKKMYLPFIRTTHGKGTVYAGWEEIKAIMDRSELIFVKWKDRYIGGGILIYLNDFAHLWINGVIDGNREYLKLGVIGAIDRFSEKRLLEKGYRKMHYGASRPFLKDGVLKYKKNRGMVLSDFIQTGFLITPLEESSRTKKFFLENPFLYLEEGELAGAFFSNSHDLDRNSLSAIHENCFMKGMRKLNIFVMDEGELPEVPPGLSKDMRVSKLLNFF